MCVQTLMGRVSLTVGRVRCLSLSSSSSSLDVTSDVVDPRHANHDVGADVTADVTAASRHKAAAAAGELHCRRD